MLYKIVSVLETKGLFNFSRLCKGILLSKFEYYGVRGLPLKLMKFYFSDRTQCVKTGGGTSTHAPTTWSSTGNVWGHYFSLFVLIIYKNQTLKLLMRRLETEVNTSLENITNWLKGSKLTLNIDKSQFLFFYLSPSRNKADAQIKLMIPK